MKKMKKSKVRQGLTWLSVNVYDLNGMLPKKLEIFLFTENFSFLNMHQMYFLRD